MRKLSSDLCGFGRVVTGSVLDCNKQTLERLLKFYDSFLYIKWNSDKLGGKGCWEIRRAPEHPSLVFHGHLDGKPLYTYERTEIDWVNHVLDAPVLHYGLIERIKRMDSRIHKDFDAHLETIATEHEQRTRKSAQEERRYDIKQHKREWREFAAAVSQGANPAQFLKGIRG